MMFFGNLCMRVMKCMLRGLDWNQSHKQCIEATCISRDNYHKLALKNHGFDIRPTNWQKVPFAESKSYLESTLDYVIVQSRNGRAREVKVFDTPYCGVDRRYWGFLQSNQNYTFSVFNAPHVKQHEAKINLPSDSAPIFENCDRCKVKSECPGTWSSAKDVFGESVFKPFE